MANQNRKTLAGRDGLLGWIDMDEQPANSEEALVHLENGTAVRVPADLLVEQDNGSYYLPMSRTQFVALESPHTGSERETILVIPVIAEELDISKRRVTSGRVQIAKHVHERKETINIPTIHQEVRVEHVAVDRDIETPPEVRYEGDTMIIPVLEEVLVVKKQLHLKEEVRVTMIQTEVREPTQVTLREEEVEVNRVESGESDKKEL